MPGLRILNVHPRLAGSLGEPERWRELFELAAATGFSMVWLNPFHRTTEVVFEEHGKRRRRSLYAIADHRGFDAAVSCGDGEQDRAALAAAIAHGRGLGVEVMIDLVLNHVAVDHPLVVDEDRRVQSGAVRNSDELLFARNERGEATDFDGGTGFDNAQVAFGSAAARRFFLGEGGESGGEGGEGGEWKRLLEAYLELGVRGFRCDMAYSVPASWWRELIGHARRWAARRGEEVVFLAETLGGKEKNLQLAEARVAERLGFELSMLSTSWWDLQAPWLGEEMAAAQRLAHHGGAGSPDNHDLPETLAERLGRELRAARPPRDLDDELALQHAVAALCERNYAAAALVGSSVYATWSYLFCLDQSSVFWEPELLARLRSDERARRGAHPLNLCGRVAAVNAFLRRLPLGRARVSWIAGLAVEDAAAMVTAFAVALHDVDSGARLGRVTVAVERSYERGELDGLAAAVAGQAQPRLEQALQELEQALSGDPEALVPEGEALWFAAPLLLACFRAAPADAQARKSSP